MTQPTTKTIDGHVAAFIKSKCDSCYEEPVECAVIPVRGYPLALCERCQRSSDVVSAPPKDAA